MSITTIPDGLGTPRTVAPVALPRPRRRPGPHGVATPPRRAASRPSTSTTTRDPFVDTLRVFAIALVVLQHWLMPVISPDGSGGLVTGNALTTPGAWIVTWISQVMPLVFFAGGAAAVYSAGRLVQGGAAAAWPWVGRRIGRLAAPVLPLAVVWVPLPHLLVDAGVPAAAVDTGSRLVGGLLWFLALYTVVVASTPLLLRWHDRRRGAEIGVLAAAAVAVDIARFATGVEALGYANLVFVWFAVYQVGVAYASGRLDALTGRAAWLVAGAGFGVTAILVAAGPYAPSMIGMPGAPVSNMNPPTVVLLALTAGQLGLALALRRRIVAWASLPEVSRAVAAMSSRLMTIYVWHTPALVAVAGVAVVGFGWSTPDPFGAEWRSAMPLWLAALTVVLTGFVRAFDRFETAGTPRTVTTSPAAVVTSVVLIGSGLLALTIGGFAPPADGPTALTGPVVAALAVAVGTALLRTRQVAGSNPLPTRERLIP